MPSAQLGYEPIWFTEANFYDRDLRHWNVSGNADNVYVEGVYVPLEDAPDDSATQQYIDIVEQSGGDIAQLGAQAASAFLLWATAAKECGSDLTRDCVMEKLSEVTRVDRWRPPRPDRPRREQRQPVRQRAEDGGHHLDPVVARRREVRLRPEVPGRGRPAARRRDHAEPRRQPQDADAVISGPSRPEHDRPTTGGPAARPGPLASPVVGSGLGGPPPQLDRRGQPGRELDELDRVPSGSATKNMRTPPMSTGSCWGR